MRASRWVALWAAMLIVFTAGMFAFGRLSAFSPLLLGGTAAGTLALALLAARLDAPRRTALAVPDVSFGTVVLAAGVSLLVGGTEVGTWMLLLGAGVLLLGAALLGRELRAERQAR
jgi:hypothetical protein